METVAIEMDGSCCCPRASALVRVLEIAEQVCEHHDAAKHRRARPEYIEVQLLEACEAARRALQDEQP